MSFKTYFNWSSGTDSALALHYLLQDSRFNIDRLLTTVNEHHKRVSMHGLSLEVLEEQAKALNIPLDILYVPENPTMEAYNLLMEQKTTELKSLGYTHTVFGDIFLEDLKLYRENLLAPYHIKTVFPLWKQDTKTLINEFLELGYRALIVCLNTNILDEALLGRELTPELISNLPKDVDPCGENGEFHTFCFDGPVFNTPVEIITGEKVFRSYQNPTDKEKDIRFGFCDLLLKS